MFLGRMDAWEVLHQLGLHKFVDVCLVDVTHIMWRIDDDLSYGSLRLRLLGRLKDYRTAMEPLGVGASDKAATCSVVAYQEDAVAAV